MSIKKSLKYIAIGIIYIFAGLFGTFLGVVIAFGFIYLGGLGVETGIEIAISMGSDLSELSIYFYGVLLGLGSGFLFKNKWLPFVPGFILGIAMAFLGWQ